MFQALFKRAEVAIEQSIGQIVVRVVMVMPFLVAAGFGTAALSLRLNRDYGSETGNLIMAGLFVVLGTVIALVAATRKPAEAASAAKGSSPAPEDRTGQHTASETPGMADADRELMFAALTSAAPVAVPYLAKMLLRNLPLVAAIAASIFVMTRPSQEPAETAAPAE